MLLSLFLRLLSYLQVGSTQGQKFATSDVMSYEGATVLCKVKVMKPRTHFIRRPVRH